MDRITLLRRKLIVYPKFQGTLLLVNTLVLVGVFLLVWFQVSGVFTALRGAGESVHLAPDHPYFRFLKMETRMLAVGIGFAFIAGVVASWIALLVFSHRMAGPMVRMRNYLKEVAEKGLTREQRLAFRKKDFFQDIPPVLERALRKSAQSRGARPRRAPSPRKRAG